MRKFVRKTKAMVKQCSVCGAELDFDVLATMPSSYAVIYECPNQCSLPWNEAYHRVKDLTNTFIYYEETEEDV